MPMPNLTPRQAEVLKFIRAYRTRNGFSPTMQEIGDSLGLTKVTAFEHVGALERKGLLLRGTKHSARSLRVSPDVSFDDEPPSRIPLLGRIAAGAPIEAIENAEPLDLDVVFAGSRQRFALQVAGDSMVDDCIADGDYVICEQCADARNGQTVVALLPSGEATLKRLYREKGGRFRLQPANPKYEPIIVDDVRVQGVVVGVVRRV
jgi:repressor LexA